MPILSLTDKAQYSKDSLVPKSTTTAIEVIKLALRSDPVRTAAFFNQELDGYMIVKRDLFLRLLEDSREHKRATAKAHIKLEMARYGAGPKIKTEVDEETPNQSTSHRRKRSWTSK